MDWENNEGNQGDQNTLLSTLRRLLNFLGAGAGGALPPPLRGSSQVPVVSNVSLQQTQGLVGSTRFTLSWTDAAVTGTKVSHYNIYAKQMVNQNQQPVLVGAVAKSPADIILQTDQGTAVTFFIQTVLENGYSSDVLSSPTISSSVNSSNVAGAPGSITNSMLADGSVTTTKLADLAVTNGKLVDNAITTTKISDGAISTPKLQANSVTSNELAANSVIAVKIAAGVVDSSKLNATEIDVGGGGGKPGVFNVFNAAGTNIGFIGTSGGNDGAWFKTISIGGTNYSTGQLKADASGNVTLTGSVNITGSDTSVTSINGSISGIKVSISGSFATTMTYNNFILSNPSTGVSLVTLGTNNGGGDILLRDFSGNPSVRLSAPTSGGFLTLNRASYYAMLYSDVDGGGNPQLKLIGSGGTLIIGPNTSTTATAGSITPPSQVAGYLIFSNGVNILKIPYYNN
jgi:hypothetical protein